MGIGIDYGRGQTNIDHATRIRYGVISQHSVSQAWADSSEADYGEPTCPLCHDKAVEYDSDSHHSFDNIRGRQYGYCGDYVCTECACAFSSDDAFGEEPVAYFYRDDGYEIVDCLDSDLMVLKSPYYTIAPFCSPCVPGAGNLDDASDSPEPNEHDGVRTYCLGHDWFEDNKAPYAVYSVAALPTVIRVPVVS